MATCLASRVASLATTASEGPPLDDLDHLGDRWDHLDTDERDRFIADAYHAWYYDSRVWERMTFLGVPCQKAVTDIWNYQEVLSELRPSLVVEFGTFVGGSALLFSTFMSRITDHFRVLTVDIDTDRVHELAWEDPHIEIMQSSTTEPAVANRIHALRHEFPGPVFAILDSDHRAEHVLGEMKLLRNVLRRGDYLIVEDSNINGRPVLRGWGDGPAEAIAAYLEEYPDDYRYDDERADKFLLSFAPGGYLIRR